MIEKNQLRPAVRALYEVAVMNVKKSHLVL